jgi:flavin reductase (DIM6/NTAB) family NADH-FMN oxidoreductase RutF
MNVLNIWRAVYLQPVRSDLVHRLFYPVVPAVVTAIHDRRVGGLLAIPSTLSFKPPMVGVTIMPTSNTYRLIQASRMFGVCLIPYSHVDKLARLAEKAPGVEDKLTWAGFEYELGGTVPVPIIRQSYAWLECTVETAYEIGDHTLYVGLVKAAYAHEDFDEYWQLIHYEPVFYVGKTRRFKDSYIRLGLG